MLITLNSPGGDKRMSITKKKDIETADYQSLQEELTNRYGPAMAQEIIDQIKKTEKTNEMPDYMNFHALSEILENLRQEAQEALKNLRNQKKSRQSRGVINLDEKTAQAEFEHLFSLYYKTQKAFYRMYRSAMAAHIEEIPSWKKYHKTSQKPEMAKAA